MYGKYANIKITQDNQFHGTQNCVKYATQLGQMIHCDNLTQDMTPSAFESHCLSSFYKRCCELLTVAQASTDDHTGNAVCVEYLLITIEKVLINDERKQHKRININ